MSDKHARQLFEQVIINIHMTKKLTQDQIRVLHTLLGSILVESLHLIDSDCVTRLDCGKDAKRQLYKIQEKADIQDSKGELLHSQLCVLYPQYHCSCKFFINSVICEQKALLCRHVLAAIIYEALNDQQNSTILDEDTFSSTLYLWNSSRS